MQKYTLYIYVGLISLDLLFHLNHTVILMEPHELFKTLLLLLLLLYLFRDAPFDFWGGGLDYYFQLCFFSLKN